MGSTNPGRQPVAGALTYPARPEPSPASSQPRQPRDLQGLLRFAMEATKVEDAPASSQQAPMDEERRRFLEQALQTLTVDLAALLRQAIATLADPEKISAARPGQAPPEDVTAAFDRLEDTIEDIDVANDFYKLGGFSVFPVCLGSACEDVRERAAAVLAALCQNNPFCQARALESGLLDVLLHLVASEEGPARATCLAALSCACREFDPACRELVAQGGCGGLARLLGGAGGCALAAKAGFFMRYLAEQYPQAKDEFIRHNVIQSACSQLDRSSEAAEQLLGLLVALTGAAGAAGPGLGAAAGLPLRAARPVLQARLQDPDSCAEVQQYAAQLLQLVDGWPEEDDEIVDR